MKRDFFLLIVVIVLVQLSCERRLNYEVNYYDNGDTLSIYHIEEDLKQGEYKLYYEGNVLKEKGIYKDNQLDGIRKIFHKNGKLKEYYFYKYKVSVYHKELDEFGNLLNNSLGVISPIETHTKSIEVGDSLLLSYTLTHTMFDGVGVVLVVSNLSSNDTLSTTLSDTTVIEKYVKEFDIGINQFQISLFEVLTDKQQIVGHFFDTLEINVLNPFQEI